MPKTIQAQSDLPKRLIWVYIILLIFEGAIRKWILPGLATPLLLVRDPIALWLIIITWKRGLFVFNGYVITIFLIGIIGLFTAVFLGHGNLLVALYGLRTLILHFPLIFIIGKIFDHEDVVKLGKFLVWLTIPITILMVLQFFSPQSSFVNRGVGGDVTEGFQGALGFNRPPTTFSFANGTTSYYSLVTCFILYFWFSATKDLDKKILTIASICVIIAIPYSISRSLLFSIIITVGFLILTMLRNPKNIGKILLFGVAGLIVFLILSELNFFHKATDVFSAGVENATHSEGAITDAIQDRYLSGLGTALANADTLPFFGYGIGMGTNVGAALLTGKATFLIAEGEWGRLIGELGVLMGLTVIVIRVVVSIKITIASFQKLSYGDLLSWLILSFCLLNLPEGEWSQPTSLGFCIVGAGLTISALNMGNKPMKSLAIKPEVLFNKPY